MFADKIIAELLSRGGFDGWWDSVDEEIQIEIQESINRIILQNTFNPQG